MQTRNSGFALSRAGIYGLLLILTAVAAFAQGSDAEEAAERNVRYEAADGTTLEGYLATPSGRGEAPGVLLIHEWWGLNNDMTRLADALAEEGFVVLAADAFRGSVATRPAGAMRQVRTTPSDQIASDLDAALEYLKNHQRVDADRVASMGFCFGGTQSMFMGTRRDDLAAVVIFYGGGPITEASRLGVMAEAGPVLGIYGEEDNNIPVSEVREFEAALEARDVEHTITIYEGVGHAFVKSDTYDQGGAPEEAWHQMVDFLNDQLGE